MVSPSNSSLRKPKLTVKQAKFVKAKTEGMTNDAAYVSAGYKASTDNVARVEGSKLLRKPNVQEALQMALVKYGLTPDTLAAGVASAAGAYKTIAVEGDLIETEVPDHSVRLKAFGMAAQFMGVSKGDATPMSVHFHQHTADKKAEYSD